MLNSLVQCGTIMEARTEWYWGAVERLNAEPRARDLLHLTKASLEPLDSSRVVLDLMYVRRVEHVQILIHVLGDFHPERLHVRGVYTSGLDTVEASDAFFTWVATLRAPNGTPTVVALEFAIADHSVISALRAGIPRISLLQAWTNHASESIPLMAAAFSARGASRVEKVVFIGEVQTDVPAKTDFSAFVAAFRLPQTSSTTSLVLQRYRLTRSTYDAIADVALDAERGHLETVEIEMSGRPQNPWHLEERDDAMRALGAVAARSTGAMRVFKVVTWEPATVEEKRAIVSALSRKSDPLSIDVTIGNSSDSEYWFDETVRQRERLVEARAAAIVLERMGITGGGRLTGNIAAFLAGPGPAARVVRHADARARASQARDAEARASMSTGGGSMHAGASCATCKVCGKPRR